MTTADLKKKRNGIQREAKRLSREVRGHEEQIAEKMILMDNMAGDLEKASAEYSKLEDEGKYFKRKRACIAYMEITVVDISISPSSFKPVSMSLSRISSYLKHPNKSFLT